MSEETPQPQTRLIALVKSILSMLLILIGVSNILSVLLNPYGNGGVGRIMLGLALIPASLVLPFTKSTNIVLKGTRACLETRT